MKERNTVVLRKGEYKELRRTIQELGGCLTTAENRRDDYKQALEEYMVLVSKTEKDAYQMLVAAEGRIEELEKLSMELEDLREQDAAKILVLTDYASMLEKRLSRYGDGA